MLSKGSELFMFEGDLFSLKKKYINRELTPDDWSELFNEFDALIGKYNFNDMYYFYTMAQVVAFIDFLEAKQENQFDVSRINHASPIGTIREDK